MTAKQYPFDPKADVLQLSGLEKLRAVQDRDLAELLFGLWFKVAPDQPIAEEYDPGTYGDEQQQGEEMHDPTDSLADQRDRDSAAIHFCWKEFYRNMEDYEREHGKRLTAQQRARHVHRFGGMLEKQYGRTYPLESWVQRRKDWEARATSTKGGFGT